MFSSASWLDFLESSFVFLFFQLHCSAWKTSIPQPGVEPRPHQWKLWILTTGWPVNALNLFFIPLSLFQWRRKWEPTPVFLPGKSHGPRSLADYIAHGVTKSQTQLKQLSTHYSRELPGMIFISWDVFFSFLFSSTNNFVWRLLFSILFLGQV